MPLNKRILASLITTLLIVSILSIPTPYIKAAKYDDLIEKISPTSGPIGVTVTVEGTAPHNITEDYPVQIYWSYTEPTVTTVEYGYAYGYAKPSKQNWELLETVKEPTTGTKEYKVDITIPYVPPTYEDKNIYIIAWQDKDNDTYVDDGEWDSIPFKVTAGIYPTTGHKGDEIVVGGWIETSGGLVEIYWENLNASNKLGETFAKADGSFTVTVTLPDPPVGTYSIIVYDASAKKCIGSYDFDLTPEISLSPTRVLPGGTVTVEGTGFSAEEEITLTISNDTWSKTLTTDPETVETDSEGSFSCTFNVPSVAYGTYTIKAEDESGYSDDATLTVGAIITLSPTEGPSGTIVTITGEGWDAVETGTEVTVTIDGIECPVVDTIKVRSDGTFEGEIIIPTLDVDTYTVEATADTISATEDFKVTGKTSITVSPISGAPGSTVTIEGVNFTALADVEVTIDFGPLEEVATAKTNSTGGFSISITVPNLTPSAEAYVIKATDENDLFATDEFRVAVTTLAISPTSGPSGTKVLIVGGGLTPDADFNVTINGKLMINGEGTLDDDGNIPSDFYVYVPTLDAGTYTVTVMDEEGVTATTTFTVTAKTEIVLSPSSAPQGYSVTIKLNYFTEENKTAITLKIYNVTADGEVLWEADLWDIITAADGFAKEMTNASGCFEGSFTVPDEWALGDYYINATDANGLFAQATFSVVEPTVIVYTGADEYMPGDTVAFFAKCDFNLTDQVINLYTPEGFKIEITDLDITTKIGSYYTGTVTYILPSDAKLGTWIWNTTISGVTVNGTFAVVEKPTIATLREDVSRLKSDLADLSKTVSDLSDIVEDLSGVVEDQASDISRLSDSIKNLRDAIGDLSSSLDKVKGDIASLSAAVSEAQSAAKEASEAASSAQSTAAGISTAVYLAVILSLIAAVATIISIIIMQRKIAG